MDRKGELMKAIDANTGEIVGESGDNALVLADKHFKFLPTGLVVAGEPDYEAWELIGRQLGYIQGAVHWWIGDWLNYGERAYGETYAQAMEETGFEYGTLANDKYVANVIGLSSRNESLSFKHHVAVAPLEPEQQKEWLDRAEEEDLSARELRHQIKEGKLLESIAELNAIEGRDRVYNVIYADPPWQYDNAIRSWGPATLHYQTMPLDEICSLPKDIELSIADDSVLFLWVTNPFLRDAFSVIDAWGFEYKTHMVWVKTNLVKPGSGFYVRGRHELLFICTRGSFTPPDKHISPPIGSVIEAPLQEHSRKPPAVYSIIERLYPGCNYIELFARSERDEWDTWGDEVGKY